MRSASELGSSLSRRTNELNDLRNQFDKSINQLQILRQQLNELQHSPVGAQLNELRNQYNDVAAQLAAKQKEYNAIVGRNAAATEQSKSLEAQMDKLKVRISELQSSVDELVSCHNQLLRANSSNDAEEGFVPALSSAARTTVDLINQLLTSINDTGLREALLKWVWERAYRPIFQRELKRLGWWDTHNAIYRIVVVDHPEMCYVGQAVSLKDR